MRSGGIAFAGCVLLLSGCAYHNVLHNSQRLFEQGEVDRRAGREAEATALYLEVVRKTGEAYRARPESEWAERALLLLGRSRLRLGDFRGAAAAFNQVSERTEDEALRREVLVYLAATRAETGDRGGALVEVNRALSGSLDGSSLAEAHLLRGRLLLEAGYADLGWWDLDRAAEVDPDVRIEAGLHRVLWGVIQGDGERARGAFDGLLGNPAGGERVDTISALVDIARARWNAERAAGLIAAVGSSSWERTARGRMALKRAELLHEAGDTAAATAEAARVARGLGAPAADARLRLAGWELARARDLPTVFRVRAILLPAGSDPRVALLLTSVDALERLTSAGLDRPIAWFAAAEVARDELGAIFLARGLFVAYADVARDGPWASKALLAALETSPDEGDRAWLRGRLETYGDSPYVLAAHGRPTAGFEALEEELQVRLAELIRQ